ncbi:MAG TPA: PilT/PilU family type 4a pilus ATPase [bacterium]
MSAIELEQLLTVMVEHEGSDLILKAGAHPFMRVNGKLVPIGETRADEEAIARAASELMGKARRRQFEQSREINFAFERPPSGRFRANVLWQRGTMAMVIRRVPRALATLEELHLPAEPLRTLLEARQGLILVTGATGSGKSTTVAAMLNTLNHAHPVHIVTLEDPVEFQFEEIQAVINQREVGTDTLTFTEGLKHVLRQSPDVLFLSDVRDLETMESALFAAESGQLVLTCLHTTNVVTTIERVIGFFPPHQHGLIRIRLAVVLRGIVSLRLVPRRDGGGRLPVCELLAATPRVRELVRTGDTGAVPLAIQDGAMDGMQTFTQALYQRCKRGEIAVEEAMRFADSPEELQLALQEIRSGRDARG